ERASATACSSTATPREPNRSKKADCGLSTPTRSASASTVMRAKRSRPRGSSSRPQALSSSGWGSMPTQSGPRVSMAWRSRVPNGALEGTDEPEGPGEPGRLEELAELGGGAVPVTGPPGERTEGSVDGVGRLRTHRLGQAGVGAGRQPRGEP